MDLILHFWELIETGGPVMIPIAVLSLWMWTLIVVKAEWLLRVRRRPLRVSDALTLLEEGGPVPDGEPGPRGGALAYYSKRYFQGKSRLTGRPDELFFEVAVRRQIQGVYRHIPTIMVLAAAAPLLGLLGTVTGMVETFRIIGIYGMGNAQAMASGIKEALITTQAGLLVAIPGVLAGQAMRKEARKIHQSMLVFQQAVTQWMEKESS